MKFWFKYFSFYALSIAKITCNLEITGSKTYFRINVLVTKNSLIYSNINMNGRASSLKLYTSSLSRFYFSIKSNYEKKFTFYLSTFRRFL